MIKQYFKNKFHIPVIVAVVLLAILRYIYTALRWYNPQKSAYYNYRILCCLTDTIIYAYIILFPAFLIYCLWSVNFFKMQEVISRFESRKKVWYKAEIIILLESVSFLVIRNIMIFLGFAVKGGVSNYFSLLPFLLKMFLFQSISFFVLALFFFTASIISKSTTAGFVLAVLLPVGESLLPCILGNFGVFIFPLLVAPEDFNFQMLLPYVLVMLVFGLSTHFVGINKFKNTDAVKVKGENDEN